MPRHGSDSDDSYRSRSRRKKSKKKSRRSSSSSSTRSSSSGKSRPRQYRRSDSREKSKHRHRSSHTKHKRRRSRSSTSSSSDSRSRSRKHSRKEHSRRSSSRSRSRGRSSKVYKESRSSPPRKSKNRESSHKREREIDGNTKKVTEEDTLRDKLEAALKAAAVADAQLREKGLLPDSTQKNQVTSVQQQLKRAEIIEEINCSSFIQKEFHSSRTCGSKAPKVPSEDSPVRVAEIAKGDSLPCADDWKTNPEKLVHPSWFEDSQVKMARWKKKLSELRGLKCNGDEDKKEV